MAVSRRVRFDLAGAVVVVTGTSSGLGRRFALDMAGAGAVVTGLARREHDLPGGTTVVCDVSDTPAFVERLGAIEAQHGRIDVLVNNAGIGAPPEEPGRPVDPYRVVMETNFFAPVAGTLAVLPGMLQRGRGVVVNVSSDTGRAPGPGEAAYGASKAALSSFTESLSFDVAGRGVHLHVLYPGWVPTGMTTGEGTGGGPTPPAFVRRTQEQVSRLLLDRMGGPRLDMDAAPVARLAPVARALAPSLYRRGVSAAGGR